MMHIVTIVLKVLRIILDLDHIKNEAYKERIEMHSVQNN